MQEEINKDSKKGAFDSVTDLDDEVLLNVSGGDYHVVKVSNYDDFYAVVDEDGVVWDYYNTGEEALQVATRKNK